MVSLNAWALYLSRLRLTYNLTIISPRLDTGFLLGITRLGVSPNYLICTEPAHHTYSIITVGLTFTNKTIASYIVLGG